jgi:hypothetical protein
MTPEHFPEGSAVDLRYVLTDGRIEMCWPCRVVQDSDDVVALFIAAGSTYRANPKRTAAEKRADPSPQAPTGEFVWRSDTLRLMFPGRAHSVWLFWADSDDERRISKFFINMEEPFRRTPAGFDTQDHTLDIVVQPDLSWQWRDEEELENHVREGFVTADLAVAARDEGTAAMQAILRNEHPCLIGWPDWKPNDSWEIPHVSAQWARTPPTFWHRQSWAYGVTGARRHEKS